MPDNYSIAEINEPEDHREELGTVDHQPGAFVARAARKASHLALQRTADLRRVQIEHTVRAELDRLGVKTANVKTPAGQWEYMSAGSLAKAVSEALTAIGGEDG